MQARRLQALREISRVLSPGGMALITVWAMEQEHKREKSKYISKKGDTIKNTLNSASWDRGDLTDETRRLDEDEGSKECDPPNKSHADKPMDEKKIYSVRESNMQCNQSPVDGKLHGPGQFDTGQCDMGQCDTGHYDTGLCDTGLYEGYSTDGHIDNGNCDVRSGKDHSMGDSRRVCNKSVISSETNKLTIYIADHNQTCQQDANGAKSSPGDTIIVHKNRTQFEQQDLLVPWHLKGQSLKTPGRLNDNSKSIDKEVFFRFYHVFVEGEMEELCQTIKDVRVIETYYDQGNWCVVFQKL
ncbi:alkylated DNA repair protein alkB homolog 8-like isoform X2 [Lytechinus variegatus]|uniref:alkylated DNA repair protein alkB homolog 8-like isoform X2 n=1 Tax=Lytechinus variegatus TaxID=7654 RepID=UPI001BB0F139|nr:alkylated DNA repair protein alkB homolog 8-like isoform X2 [Lytechinus variegatus]